MRRKTARKRSLIGIGAAVSLAAILIVLFLPKPRFQPGSFVFRALEESHDACLAEFTRAFDEVGLTPILRELEKEGSSTALSLTFPSEEFGNVSASLMQSKSAAGDARYMQAEIKVMGFVLRLFECSIDKQFASLAVPLLFQGVYGISFADLAQTFPQSALAGILGFEEEAIQGISDYLDAAARFSAAETLGETTERALARAIFALEGSFESTGPLETTVSVNNHAILSERYVTEISPATVERVCFQIAEALLKDDLLTDYLQAALALNPDASRGSLQEYWKDYETLISQLFAQINSTTLTTYHKGGLVLRAELSLLNQYNSEMCFVFELGGGKNLTDALTFRVDSDGTNILRFTHRGNVIPIDGTLESELTLTYRDPYMGQKWGAKCFVRWDSKKTEHNFYLNLRPLESPSVCNLYGTLRLDQGVFIDPFEVYCFDGYSAEYSFPLSLYITPGEAIQARTADAKDLMHMSEAELFALLEEIENSAQRWRNFLF